MIRYDSQSMAVSELYMDTVHVLIATTLRLPHWQIVDGVDSAYIGQFWFTLFHELGHVLLHGQDRLFLEMDDDEQSVAEEEADNFALETLLENVGTSALREVSLTDLGIARFARKAGIAPGIVVGQLQALGRIPYSHFNYLKVRYKW